MNLSSPNASSSCLAIALYSSISRQKSALGHRPSRQSVQSTSGEEYNEIRAHHRILNLTYEYILFQRYI